MSHPNLDMTNIEGTSLTICLVVLGKIISFLPAMSDVVFFLQGLSYLLAVIVGIDTMIGSPLRTKMTTWYKKKFTKNIIVKK
jgi:hypothetical protein